MDIKISNAGGVPIYEQIAAQIKAKVISGELREGDALPSMRLLAKELRIRSGRSCGRSTCVRARS